MEHSAGSSVKSDAALLSPQKKATLRALHLNNHKQSEVNLILEKARTSMVKETPLKSHNYAV